MSVWMVGVVMNISGSILCNVGILLIKKYHILSVKDRNSEWKIGFLSFVLGSVINFVSFSFASPSLLGSLGSVQFISNVFFAKYILNEHASYLTYIGTFVIITGIIVTVLFSNHETHTYTNDQLLALYDSSYLMFISIVACILIILEGIFWYYNTKYHMQTPLPYSHVIRPLLYSINSAVVGTQSILQSKCLSEIIKSSIIKYDNQFMDIFLYYVIVVFLVGLSFWLYRLNQALIMFDALVIIPVLQICWTVSAIVQGGIFFKDFQSLSFLRIFGFAIGLVIILLGVFVLTSANSVSDNSRRQLLAGEDDVEDNDYNTNSADGCKDSKDVDSCIKLVSKVRRNSNKSDHSSIMLIDVVKDPV